MKPVYTRFLLATLLAVGLTMWVPSAHAQSSSAGAALWISKGCSNSNCHGATPSGARANAASSNTTANLALARGILNNAISNSGAMSQYANGGSQDLDEAVFEKESLLLYLESVFDTSPRTATTAFQTSVNINLDDDVVLSGTVAGTLTLVTGANVPNNGSVTYNNSLKKITYTPNNGWAGDDTFTYRARNSGDTLSTAERTVTVTTNPPPKPEITSANAVNAKVGDFFSYPIVATNSPTSYSHTNLPPGLSRSSNSNVISGTPTNFDLSHTATITASNVGGDDTENLVFNIAKGDPTFALPEQLPNPQPYRPGTTFSIDAATSDSPATITYNVSPGSRCTNSGLTVTKVGIGVCTITASQGSSTNWNDPTDRVRTVTISQAIQVLNFPAQVPGSYAFVDAATFPIDLATSNAATDSGNPITYSSLTNSVCTVSGTTVTMESSGTCTIAANQAGTALYAPAAQVTRDVVLTAGEPGSPVITSVIGGNGRATIVFTPPPNPGSPVTSYTGTCTLGGGSIQTNTSPNLPVIVTGLTNGAPWTCNVTATNAIGTSLPSSTVAVIPSPSVTAVAPVFRSPTSASFTIGTDKQFRIATTGTPNATVTIAGTLPAGLTQLVLLAGTRTVFGTADPGSAGSYTFTVTATNASGTATQNFRIVVSRAPQTITFPDIADRRYAPAPATFSLAATASSLLPVSYTSQTAPTCSVNTGGAVSMLAVGTCTILASQSGDPTYAPATGVPNSFEIIKATQAISWGVLPNRVFAAAGTFTISPEAAASSLLPITYTSNSPTVCSMNGTTVTMNNVGTCNLTASQDGDLNYLAARDFRRSFSITQAAQTIVFPAQPAQAFVEGGTFAINPPATGGASGNPVIYTSLSTGVCTIVDTTVTIVSSGVCNIAANQAGSSNYLAALQVTVNISINPVVPGAPSAQLATPGDSNARIEFTPPNTDGGTPLIDYRVTCNPGSVTANAANSPVTVSGLPNAVPHSCTVAARNSIGTGPESNALAVTPLLRSGASLWQNACSGCHGVTPSAGRFNAAGDSAAVLAYVRGAQADMLANSIVQSLTANELAAIASYIKSFLPAIAPSTNYVTPLVIDVGLPNHLYLGGVSFTEAVVVTPPSNGTLSMLNGTLITYTPNAGFAGTDSFTYRGRRTTPQLVEGDARTVTITVNAPLAPSITSAATANGVFGELFSYQITASNLPNVFSASGLPPGTLLNTSTGLISGTATAAGSFNTMVSATNPGGTGNLSVGITISATTQNISFGAQTSPRAFSVGSFAVSPLATGGGSGNPITYSSTTPAVCNVTGITVTVVAAGTCTIAANQAGNTNYNAALPQTQNVTITASPPGAPVLNSATPGDGTATLAFNAPSNTGGTTITLYNATCSPSGVGSSSVSPIVVSSLTNNTQYTCTVTATNSAGTGPVSNAIMVTPLNTPVPPQFTSANATTFTALVNGNFPVTATGTPSPTLALFSGSLPSGVSFSGGTGSGTLSGIPATGSAASSPYVVTFRASGTAPNADQTFTLTVAKANQTITFANPGPQAFSVSTIPLNVSATSGLSVTLTSDPSSVCTVSGTNLTTVAPGVCSITATQAGNVDVNAANTIINAFSINKANQTITFGAQTTPRNFSTVPFALSPVAFATSAQPILYSTTTPSVCVMSGNNVNTLTAGVCTIAANQAGNANYNAALQVTQSVTINAIAPNAPTIGAASGSDMQASIAFTVPASNGGSPITQYTATCNAGNFTGTGSASPVIVSGLTNGTAYTCSVTATNSAGPSNASGTVMVTPTSANGGALWSSVCAACHSQAPSGNQLNGAGSTATVLQHVRVTQTLMAIFPTVQNLTQSDLAAIAIYIRDQLPVNAPTTAQNTPLPINVGGHIHLTNQTWSAFTSVEVVTPPTNGMLSAFTGTTAIYTPNNGYSGTDSFTYRGKRTSPDVTGDAVQITITVQPGVPVITSAGSANGTFNTAFSYTIMATGTPTSYGATGLPPGFIVDTSTGEITGVPNATGTFNATVSATNAGGTGQAPLTIVIAPAAQVIIFGAQTPPTRPYVFGGAFTINPTATGGASGQAVSYGTTTPAVCAVSGVNVDILAAGSCILTANQAGSANYAPATEATQTVTITAVVPEAPLIGAATAGNGSAQIAFSAPTNTGGAPITGYTATCLPSGSGTGGTSPITVGGLVNGTTYTCTVRAANSAGQGAISSSVQVTPAATSVPDAPVIGIPIELDGAASIAFSPPANNGGVAITQYTATCNPGGKTGNNAVSPVLVGSLTNGVTYTCTVTATNSIGTGPSSAPVDVTPQSSITFVGAKSQKLHVATTYGLPILNVASIDVVPLTVEPRAIGSGHKIVFEFTDAINAVNDAIVTDELGAPVNGIATTTFRVGSTVEVSISGLADNRRIGVALFNVNGTGLIAKAYLGFLIGDVTQSKSVNAADIAAIKARIGQSIATGSNYLFDVNLSGAISGADVSQAKARSGLVIP